LHRPTSFSRTWSPVRLPGTFQGSVPGRPDSVVGTTLRELLTETDAPVPVWPHPTGDTRGIALGPVHPAIPNAALRNDQLYERLALVEALGGGRRSHPPTRSRRAPAAGSSYGESLSIALLEEAAASISPIRTDGNGGGTKPLHHLTSCI
jgi:hypothetical protein